MGKYDDIINLPHPVSAKHKRMEIGDRAAQFASFAALTGYSDTVAETARLTDRKPELDETVKEELDAKLRSLNGKTAKIAYFVKDERKPGGMILERTGTVKRTDAYKKVVVMCDKTEIPVDDIMEIEEL